MGYNVNKLSIIQMEKYLAQVHNNLLTKEERKLEWVFDTSYLASRFLYRLRQAIHSAHKLGIPPYDTLSGRFSLRQNGKKVEIERKYGTEFNDVQVNIIDAPLEIKGTDSFQIISAITGIELDNYPNGIKLVDVKEVSPVLKGWLETINCTYENGRSGTLIKVKEKDATAT